MIVNLKTAWAAGIIDKNTFVWGEDMDEFAPIGMVYGLERAVATPDSEPLSLHATRPPPTHTHADGGILGDYGYFPGIPTGGPRLWPREACPEAQGLCVLPATSSNTGTGRCVCICEYMSLCLWRYCAVRLAALGTGLAYRLGTFRNPFAPFKGHEKKSLEQLQKEALADKERDRAIMANAPGQFWPGMKAPSHALFLWAGGSELTKHLDRGRKTMPDKFIPYETRSVQYH